MSFRGLVFAHETRRNERERAEGGTYTFVEEFRSVHCELAPEIVDPVNEAEIGIYAGGNEEDQRETQFSRNDFVAHFDL